MSSIPYGSAVPKEGSQRYILYGMGLMSTMFVVIIALLFLRVDHRTEVSHTQIGPGNPTVVTVEKPVIVEKTVTVERTVDKPVIIEKPVIVERPVVIEKEVIVEKEVVVDPKEKWGRSGTLREPTDRDVCELLALGYVVEDYHRRQFKVDRRGDMWTREPSERAWRRWKIADKGWATYRWDSVDYPLEYWEDEEAAP